MAVEHVPVLIVGAGAGGLATSALLAEHGVRSLLVEKRREIFIYPKARNLSFRSLEILRALGLEAEVHAVAERVSDMVVKPTLDSAEEKLAIDIDAFFAGLDQLSPEPAVQYCPQSSLEPMLLADTRRRGSEVRYATQMCSFEQDDSGVTAVLRDVDSGESEHVRADYLIAADGVHSRIRESLGVTTSGYGALPIFVVFIYFRAPWRRFVPHLSEGDGVQIKNPDVDGIFLVAKDDLGMFITTYFPGEGETAAQFTPQYCAELLTKAVGEQIDVEIIEVAAWQPYEQVADQFQCGRVFLVGDCAHTMPPFKAGGANTAIQSAHNLAWKLAAVVRGWAGAALLASYHAERHPVGGSPLASRSPDRQWACCDSRTTVQDCRRRRKSRCSLCWSATNTARLQSFWTTRLRLTQTLCRWSTNCMANPAPASHTRGCSSASRRCRRLICSARDSRCSPETTARHG